MAMAAARAGVKTLYVPAANAAEATLADGLTVYGVETAPQLLRHLRGEERLAPAQRWEPTVEADSVPDFADVMGQENVKRALRSPPQAPTTCFSSARPVRASPCLRGVCPPSSPT